MSSGLTAFCARATEHLERGSGCDEAPMKNKSIVLVEADSDDAALNLMLMTTVVLHGDTVKQ